MTLRDKIDHDFKEAAKNKAQLRLSTLRLLNAAIKNKEVDKRTKLSKTEASVEKLEKLSRLEEEEIISVVSSETKKRKEAAEQYIQGGRPELASKEQKEIEILACYLPEQLSEDDLKKMVEQAIKKVGASSQADLGKVMGVIMGEVKGKADGNLVNKIVKEMLS